MAEALTPVEVLCCYSHADEKWLHRLETHLSLLQRQGFISLWHDRRIIPGTEWAKAIDTHLETASVILLLVSADFLASDYCYGTEMKRALERQEAGEARVVPILVRPVDWKGAPFAHLQALPTDAKPIAAWRSKEQALVDVAAGIRRVIEDVPLLAASAPRAALPAIWNIPYPRNPFFLGRETELAQVRHHLRAGQATALSQPQAISGLGGIGKSQLALEYVYRYHLDYQAILWVRAESTEALVSSYVAIASLLRLPEREAKEQGIIVQAVKAWLQTHRGWLLVLDNADELTLIPAFLPSSPGGHLLLTTRAAATGPLAHRLEIETMLAHLARHPHLTLFDLLGLLCPQSQDVRLVQRPLDPLLMELSLVKRGRPWEECTSWRSRERYQLTERGLRYLTVRHGLTPSYHLEPEQAAGEEKKRISPRDAGVRWHQKGAWGLAMKKNREHTNALYRCVLEVIRLAARSRAYQVLAWKSEREAVLPFYDSKQDAWLWACPDAELLYVREGSRRLESVFIEYDRDTSSSREYEGKFEAYADYQRFTRTRLSPVLMVIQRPATGRLVRQAIHDVDAGAVPVLLVLESDLLRRGLVDVLSMLEAKRL